MAASLGAASVACLAPPGGQPPEDGLPPVIDLSRVTICPRPGLVVRAGRLDQGLEQPLNGNCSQQFFTLGGVTDGDSDRLLFRWVANNASSDPNIRPQIPSQLGEGEERRDPDDPDAPFTFGILLTFPGPFETQMKLAAFSDGQSQEPARLSLFVTDAPEWSHDADEAPPENDFMAIPEGSGTVTGFEWQLVFERGTCEIDPPEPCVVQP